MMADCGVGRRGKTGAQGDKAAFFLGKEEKTTHLLGTVPLVALFEPREGACSGTFGAQEASETAGACPDKTRQRDVTSHTDDPNIMTVLSVTTIEMHRFCPLSRVPVQGSINSA